MRSWLECRAAILHSGGNTSATVLWDSPQLEECHEQLARFLNTRPAFSASFGAAKNFQLSFDRRSLQSSVRVVPKDIADVLGGDAEVATLCGAPLTLVRLSGSAVNQILRTVASFDFPGLLTFLGTA